MPAVASPFRPAVWVTGSPRTDLLLARRGRSPGRPPRPGGGPPGASAGRRLVLWSRAEREDTEPAEVAAGLADLVAARGAVLGLRTPGETTDGVLDLSTTRFPDVEVVLRLTDVLVSDYTSDLVDFLVTDRPVVCFAPDIDAVRERVGFVVDPDAELPGGAVRDLDALLDAVGSALDGRSSRRDRSVRRRPRPPARVPRRAQRRARRPPGAGDLPADPRLAEGAPSGRVRRSS